MLHAALISLHCLITFRPLAEFHAMPMKQSKANGSLALLVSSFLLLHIPFTEGQPKPDDGLVAFVVFADIAPTCSYDCTLQVQQVQCGAFAEDNHTVLALGRLQAANTLVLSSDAGDVTAEALSVQAQVVCSTSLCRPVPHRLTIWRGRGCDSKVGVKSNFTELALGSLILADHAILVTKEDEESCVERGRPWTRMAALIIWMCFWTATGLKFLA
jgi:hypothetical protein